MTANEIAAAAETLEPRSPEEILAWSTSNLRRVTFATGFGVEGCVLIDMVARANLPIDLFTLDTGVLFSETHSLWKQLEQRYGVTIRSVKPAQTLAEQAAAHGDRLWERDPDACCALRKVAPL